MALYYLIPNTSGGVQSLASGATAISAAIQPSSTETVTKVNVQASKKCSVFIQHTKTTSGAFSSYNPDTGIEVDEKHKVLYYYLPADFYLRTQVNNTEGAVNEVKLWVDTDTDPVYCRPDGVYRACGLTNSVIAHSDIMEAIVLATAEVDRITGQAWGSRTATEKFNGNNTEFYFTRKFPLISVTSLDVNGTSITVGNLELDEDTGRVGLDSECEVGVFYTHGDGFMKNEITYSYGRATTPQEIVKLTECIAAVMALTQQTGGTYDDITSYRIGDREVSVGEPWVNIENTMKHLEKMIKSILSHIPKPFNVY